MTQLHPSHRLFCWLAIVVAIQGLSGNYLLGALLVLPLLGRAILVHAFRLVRRARWLLLSLLAVMAWGVAGEPVWELAGVWSPTYEGLVAGVGQITRLVLVLGAVAALLETTPIERIMAGCYGILQPLQRFGVVANSIVVRLSLVLHYADQQTNAGWRQMLLPSAPTGPQQVQLLLPVVNWHDRAAVSVMGGFALLVLLT